MYGFNLFSSGLGPKKGIAVCQHSGPWHYEKGILFAHRTCILCGYFETQDSDLLPILYKRNGEQAPITPSASETHHLDS